MRTKFGYLILAAGLLAMSCSSRITKKERFNQNWQFTISEKTIQEIQMHNSWDTVSLPHTAVVEPRVMNGQWQGTCWYKKIFEVPESAKGQRLILHFEGAMHVSDFWVNGIKVASHAGGYLPVVFDFTEEAKPGKLNTILVKLDNTDNPVTGPKPMHNLDFNMFGGLYRDAWFVIENPLHISDPILANKVAGGGVFVTYPKVSKEKAIVSVKTNVVNKDKSGKNFKVINEIWQNDNLIASHQSNEFSLPANNNLDVLSNLVVDNPELWSPKSPSLYKLKTKVVSNNTVVDEEETRIGIRRIQLTKEGFYLNGEKMFLPGVNRHQEYPYIGYALSNNAQYRDAVKIKEAGFDYIRLSHYPQSKAFMDACDELGLVVINAILGWQYFSDNEAFKQHQYRASRDLIRHDRNHPCAIAWELSLNESLMTESFIDTLVAIGHQEYPGDQCYVAGWMDYGYDVYLQARQHRLHWYEEPEKPYVVSEYGDWEYYAMNAGLNQDSWGDLLQEERSSRQLLSDGEVRLLQQATNIQEAHNDNYNTPAFADGYWVMFDYNRGYTDDLEASGIMSIDRIPKFSYYFFQSQRDPSVKSDLYKCGPMVKIASWWTENSPTNVKVYSNCEEVELLLNGKSLGKRQPDENAISSNLSHPPFTFNLTKFEAGELKASAFINGKPVAQEIVRTPGKIASIELNIDYSGKLAEANCNDVLFVYASLVDKNGTVVRLNNETIKFEVSGDAILVSPDEISTEAGIAAGLIKIGSNQSAVNVAATWKDISSEKAILF